MDKKQIIDKTAAYVEKELSGESTGHDWWHVSRVWKNAKLIAAEEDADLFVVELAALLHDIADHKFHDDDHMKGASVAREWLVSLGVDVMTVDNVCEIIQHLSFSKNKEPLSSVEGRIIQDADRLDALGAIGLARVFATGQKLGNPIFDPDKKEGTAIGHFYDKLLLLKDMMNTKKGKALAAERHAFLEAYLKQFYEEWG